MKLNKWVYSVAAAGKELVSGDRRLFAKASDAELDLRQLCEDLLSSKGEALGTALACAFVETYAVLDESQKVELFMMLCEDFSIPKNSLSDAIEGYLAEPTADNRYELHQATEPRRQELFRRINMAPFGTSTLVGLRSDLLKLLKAFPAFAEIDADLRHLMSSWFNRGFLRLVRIDWKTPAHILEKLIAYEAVHAMDGWDDLRRRLADDRRCFAFFHPAMDDEPLIFVEVALTSGLAGSVQDLLQSDVDKRASEKADTAVFYSISDCQHGLKGISFGNFLIKQVVMELQAEVPSLSKFATLSPIPGFARWLEKNSDSLELPVDLIKGTKALNESNESKTELGNSKIQDSLMKLCALYLFEAKCDKGPLDPVARFHLRNGASIGRLNWQADTSVNGLSQSYGIMVNYRYDFKLVEKRHEEFVNSNIISIEKGFNQLLDRKH